ncbi:MAG TPA: hypothetical protein VN228_00340 [Pyrinomonadaceae bacterium]|nr:hypothetical protein [Pyrinomonadaceae bacterium]
MRRPRLFTPALCALCLLTTTPPAGAQPQQPAKQTKASAKKPGAAEADPMEEVRRATAISLVNALADEARAFREPVLRSRVQARAADALWGVERERARQLFRRAWAEAEAADADADRRVAEERRRQQRERGSFSTQLPPSLRTEVLRLAARRDRALGEEFLARMDAAGKEKADATESPAPEVPGGDNDRDTNGPGPARNNDPIEAPPAVAKRLRLAVQLLEDGDVQGAIQFADPALASASAPALEFLARLRPKDAKAADERYGALLVRAALDPASDANTASLLSSYLFTPALYVTFSPSGGSNSTQWSRNFPAPNDLPRPLVAAYFNAASAILLRPVPPPDQDRTSSGRTGWYMAISRLLTLFDRHAPDKSAALRARQAVLAQDTPERMRGGPNNALTRGLVPEDPNRDRVGEALSRLDRARTQAERDAVYVDAVFSARQKKDPRVEEFLNKIEDADLRKRLRAYIDFEATQEALREKDAAEALRLARGGSLTPIQRAWALTEAAKLLSKTETARALELLEEALAEARERIDPASPERASALVAIATQLVELDRARAWEVTLDAVKASNAAAGYTGEDGRLNVRLETKNMVMASANGAPSFDLSGIFATLAREDLNRAVALTRNFEGESPRAVATLAVARAVLDPEKK